MGQTTNRDSLSIERNKLKSERESLKTKFWLDCSDFELGDNPTWADDINRSKTYYRNCMWSGTYVVLNEDSTFLFIHNGEGNADYLQKGKWEIKNDSILILKSIDSLTLDFKLKMKKFDNTIYKSNSSFTRQFMRRQNILVQLTIKPQ